MKRYWKVQLRRLIRPLPWALLTVLVILAALLLVARGVMEDARQDNQKMKVAVVGIQEDPLLQMGLTALQNMDASRYSLEMIEMDEAQAKGALERGEIVGYGVIPPDFAQEALYGHFLPITFVTTPSTAGMVSVLKEEITAAVEEILVTAQKGIYGSWNLLTDHQLEGEAPEIVNGISLTYVELVLARNRVYTLEELGISQGLSLGQHLALGILVVFLMLAALCYSPVLVGGEHTLSRLLASRGVGAGKQILAELGSFLVSFGLLLLCAGVLALMGAHLGGFSLPPAKTLLSWLWTALPVVVMVAAWSFFLFSLAKELVSGVLLVALLSLALCFAGGCMYPASFFPDAIRQVSRFLPTGLAMKQLSCCVTGGQGSAGWLLLYSAGFAALTWLHRIGCILGGGSIATPE